VKVVRTIPELRAELAARRGASTGLVPTMGALHEGHLALLRAARAECHTVVMSLFVNPAQFQDGDDLARYPRDEERDLALAGEEGVDLVFAPSAEELYPPGHATWVEVEQLGSMLEGVHRPGHFRGVATVCLILFTLVRPDRAYFGQKDAQQVAVLRRMVADLDLPVALEIVPTVREPDGLALSSRNVRLDAGERERAVALSRGLRAAEAAIGEGERDAARLRAAALSAMTPHGVEPEYLALVDPDSFQPVHTVNGRVLVAVAARVGSTRLIDNALVQTDGGDPTKAPTMTKEP
jgi:pantoate--beta-alanine ligase